ncbi:glycosyltransferase family 2 protein [Bradyrhizobium sp. CB1015]|uniref:glycosyltransferase family 2 protein n=1 Tax=Bradyrhizobium sp. CB1015 TaxID=2976822 RepID=UPI0021AA8338|nr:glycosyltransferase family 2 protein [Bradyrhizobium sp. CB1015]UWU90636.1 glycosyltransferase family 2 protein [Bradyrhizobium sp. CB1015]
MTEAVRRPGKISIVIPIFNEEDNIEPLYAALVKVSSTLDRDVEVILVDDGSTDQSRKRLERLAASDPRFKVIAFARNCGQTAAMMAGIDAAEGDIIVPMDGDLQNDPADIPHLLAKMEEGFDVVSGWRRDRQDNALFRNFPSRLANLLISWLSGLSLHDYGCTLKAYRADLLRGFRLYGEMHRFIPIYAAWQGGRVTEMPVMHHPRRAGKSKYGLERVFKVVLDLLLVKFLTRYETKPIYVFGGAAVAFFALGFFAGIYALWLKFADGITFIQTPLPLLVSLCAITGTMCILMGLLAELMVRIYFESQSKRIYDVRYRLNFDVKSN